MLTNHKYCQFTFLKTFNRYKSISKNLTDGGAPGKCIVSFLMGNTKTILHRSQQFLKTFYLLAQIDFNYIIIITLQRMLSFTFS